MTLRGNRSDEKRHRVSYPRLGVGHGGEEVAWRARDDAHMGAAGCRGWVSWPARLREVKPPADARPGFWRYGTTTVALSPVAEIWNVPTTLSREITEAAGQPAAVPGGSGTRARNGP